MLLAIGNGTSIIDRKKNIFKLAQGEYIAVEKVEDAYFQSPLIGQVFVYGDSFKPSLVMVAVPDQSELLPWASKQGFGGDFAALCAKPEVAAAVLAELKALPSVGKLKGFEKVKALHLEGQVNELGQGFNIENNCLTPTFKLRRPQLKDRYKAQIDSMYQSLPQ